jgi:malate dehydrogenase (oxaloacetate-decarboxylating)
VMEGKAALFKEFADIDAYPICVDAAGPAELIAVAKAIARVRGHQPGGHGRPGLLRGRGALRRELDIPVFHDDQHGTAVVVLAALENACRVVETRRPTCGSGARRRGGRDRLRAAAAACGRP